MVAVYAILFPYIMRIKTDNYLQYLICGVIPWNFFTTVMSLGMGSIKNNAGVIKKVYFPREILPISATLSGLVNFFIACLIIIIFCVFGGLVINMLFYGTPILYPAELFPEAIRWVLYLNPFTHIVSAYRDFFMYHTLPAMSSVIYMVVMALICFALGMFIFRKLEKGFAEEI